HFLKTPWRDKDMVARAKNDGATVVVVRKYGLLDPLDWGEDCQGELWRMNQLWNRCVEIERAAAQAYAALFLSDPDYAQLAGEHEGLQRQIDAAFELRQ